MTKSHFRIKLVPLMEKDINDEFVTWHKANHTSYYSSTKREFSRDELISDFNTGRKDNNLFYYGIHHIADDKMIGTLKIGIINHVHKLSDMVVLIGDSNYLRKGIAVEAIILGNEIAFRKHDLRKLSSGMYKNNIGSVKAYLRAGWVIEGVLRNHYVFDGEEQDRILVSCFNPSIFTNAYSTKGSLSFEDIYGAPL